MRRPVGNTVLNIREYMYTSPKWAVVCGDKRYMCQYTVKIFH